PLVVDLRSITIATWRDLWEALTGPCGLPAGLAAIHPSAAMDAWIAHLDPNGYGLADRPAGLAPPPPAHPPRQPRLALLVTATGFFAPGHPDGSFFTAVTRQTGHAEIRSTA